MSSLRQHSDKELLVCLRQGDLRAFDELYGRYVSRLLAFAQSFFYDRQVAEEAVQEIFIRIWEKRKDLDESKSFKTYLFQAVKFYMYNVLRDRKVACSLENVPDEVFEKGSSVQDDLEYLQLEELAFSAIKKLPRVQQEVFKLNRLEGQTAEQIAHQLNLSKRTIEHHLYLATRTVRNELEGRLSVFNLVFLVCFF